VIEVLAGWRWNFAVYFAYGFIVFSFALFGLKESLTQEARRNPMQTILGYGEVLANPQFTSAVVMLGAGFGAFLMWNVIGPYIVQIKFGYSASFFGLTALGVGSCYLVGTMFNRALIKRNSAVRLMSLGIKTFGCGVLIILSGGIPLNLLTAVGGIMLISLAQGFIFSNAMASSMSLFPSRAGAAASLQGCLMIAIGSAASASVSAIGIESNLGIAIAFFCLLTIAFIAYRRLVRDEVQLARG
jgi:predicted MFS family arabinose efflux permease